MQAIEFLDVVALILVHKGNILIAQRPENDRLSLKWEFPGGKVEDGETFEEALRREILEELAIEIIVEEYFMTSEYNLSPVPVRLHAYFAKLKSGEIHSRVHNQVKWVPIIDLKNYEFAPADVPIVNAMLNKNEFKVNV